MDQKGFELLSRVCSTILCSWEAKGWKFKEIREISQEIVWEGHSNVLTFFYKTS